MDEHYEKVEKLFNAGKFADFEESALSYVKERGSAGDLQYRSLMLTFNEETSTDLLQLMYESEYFQTPYSELPDVAANPTLLGLTPKGEKRLQELLIAKKTN